MRCYKHVYTYTKKIHEVELKALVVPQNPKCFSYSYQSRSVSTQVVAEDYDYEQARLQALNLILTAAGE